MEAIRNKMMNWPDKNKQAPIDGLSVPNVNQIAIDVEKVMERVELYEEFRYGYLKLITKVD